jgi:hypothetical protein
VHTVVAKTKIFFTVKKIEFNLIFFNELKLFSSTEVASSPQSPQPLIIFFTGRFETWTNGTFPGQIIGSGRSCLIYTSIHCVKVLLPFLSSYANLCARLCASATTTPIFWKYRGARNV